MNRRNILRIGATTLLGLGLLPGSVVAQQNSLKDQLVGTWILVQAMDVHPDGSTSNPWGDNPKGTYMFDASGHFTQMLMRSDLPKMANRMQGTAEQNKAVATGSVAFYGTYTVDEAAKVIHVHFEGSTFAAFNGKDGSRNIVSLTANELKTSNPATSSGMKANSVWRRAQ